MFLYTPFTFERKCCFIVFLLMKFKRQNSQSHCCNLKLAIAAKFDENWNSVATKIKLSFSAFNNIIGSLYNSKNLLSFLYRYAFVERWTYFTFWNSFMSTLHLIILPNIWKWSFAFENYLNDFFTFKCVILFGTSVTVAHYFIKQFFTTFDMTF